LRHSEWQTSDKRIATVLPALLGLALLLGAWGRVVEPYGMPWESVALWIGLPIFAAAYLSLRCRIPFRSKHWHPDLVGVGV
jgi:hypothetical protein